MDGTNGNDLDEGLSPVPADTERIVILDAGAQYGKVRKDFSLYSFKLDSLLFQGY